MAKRKSAEQSLDTTPADDEIVNITAEPPKATAAAESSPLGTDLHFP